MSSKLETQAQEALRVIAEAANQATKVVATAAAEASKITANNLAGDHDLLIKLETKLDGLIVDVKLLNEGTSGKLSDHEGRIRIMESKILTWGGALLAIQFISGIILWYFGKQ